MKKSESNEYVLGTHSRELWRLGFQHQIWAGEAFESWKRAGFTLGDTLLDLGCGPGFVTRDLAYLVGDVGRVIAVDKSAQYVEFVQKMADLHDLTIDSRAVDFSEMSLNEESLDGVYCRWALAWLENAEKIIQTVIPAMKRGAHFVTQEYLDWKTFQTEPYSAAVKIALEAILASFDAGQGDINIGRHIPRIFEQNGLEVVSVIPMSKVCRPGQLTWYWPKTFLHIYLPRVVDMGFLSEDQMKVALDDWSSLEKKAGTICFTPQMVEVIGRKP